MDGLETKKKARVNIYLSEVQQERMEELCRLHGHNNLSQCAKFLLQRGLIIECSSAGIIHTNEKIDDMLEIMKTDVAGLSSTATESQVRDNTINLDFEESDEKGGGDEGKG